MDSSDTQHQDEPENVALVEGDKHERVSMKMWRGKKHVYEKLQGK